MHDTNISIINDEISNDFGVWLNFLKENSLNFVELRTIDSKNILDVEGNALTKIEKVLSENGIAVSVIASPLFKWFPDTLMNRTQADHDAFHFDPFLSREQKRFYILRAFEVAQLFCTKNIRIFSLLQDAGIGLDFWGAERELYELTFELAQKYDMTLLLENEPACNFSSAEHLRNAREIIGNRPVKLLFDVGNTYFNNDPFELSSLESIKSLIVYMHVKDYDSKKQKYVPLGQGSVPYQKIFNDFVKKDALPQFISLETHVHTDKLRASQISLEKLKKLLSGV